MDSEMPMTTFETTSTTLWTDSDKALLDHTTGRTTDRPTDRTGQQMRLTTAHRAPHGGTPHPTVHPTRLTMVPPTSRQPQHRIAAHQASQTLLLPRRQPMHPAAVPLALLRLPQGIGQSKTRK